MTLEKVPTSELSSRPRASSPKDPAEWDITEDGWRFAKGDRVYNYYDCVWVTVLEDPKTSYSGWFDTTGGSLNSVRVAAQKPRR